MVMEVEVCDPCEANKYAYSVNGIAVSDFITPHFYDPVTTSAARYSFGGNIKRPRQILPGGYISWVNPATNQLQQLLYVDPGPPKIVTLGSASGMSLRVWIDNQMRKKAAKDSFRPYKRKLNAAFMKKNNTKLANLREIAKVRGKLYD